MFAVWSHLQLFLIVWKADRKTTCRINVVAPFALIDTSCIGRHRSIDQKSSFSSSSSFLVFQFHNPLKVKNCTANRQIVGVMTPFLRFYLECHWHNEWNAPRKRSLLVTKSKSNMPTQRKRHNKCVICVCVCARVCIQTWRGKVQRKAIAGWNLCDWNSILFLYSVFEENAIDP